MISADYFVCFWGEAVRKSREDLGIEEDGVPMKILILPSSVVCIRESFDDEEKPKGSVIYLSSGENYWVEDDLMIAAEKLNIKVTSTLANERNTRV